MDMYNNNVENQINEEITLEKIADCIVRGGWPSNLLTPLKSIGIIPKSYINSILDKDINDDKNRDKNKMRMLLRSLARNESTIVTNKTILRDIEENGNELIQSRITTNDYISVLNRLHILEYQNAYSQNYRSSNRVGKTAKMHFTDPSLAAACLDMNREKMLDDLNTFGFLFEALVERDLKIYMEYLEGNIFHFRDNVTGLEVDTILEFADGNYAAVEIKLGMNGIEKAKESLLQFYENAIKKPKFMCIVVGYTDVIAKDPETGIYIIPITALKP